MTNTWVLTDVVLIDVVLMWFSAANRLCSDLGFPAGSVSSGLLANCGSPQMGGSSSQHRGEDQFYYQS